ncbi:MAG: Gfo/Idh/MocA family oxidoreductase [Candidatus Latescibacteria bacterium]|nr:Gfo/Idh/MocA family oxidoreductase [Candidatus Latescibacterota bacterium]
MKIGIMGVHYGHIGGMFRSAVQANNGEIVGIVEPDDALYSKYTEEKPIPRYMSLQEMIDQAQPDLVLEGLSHEEKTDAIETCARAGIHMLLDKPLCRTQEEWQRIQTAVETSGIKLSTNFTSRSHSGFIALREAILNGDLGELVSLISTHPHKIGDTPPPLYLDPNRYVGTFHDLAGHGVDQVRRLTGAEYTGVHALGTLKKHVGSGLTFDHVQASFQLSNGALATLTADWLTPKDAKSFGDTRFIIMGTEGSAHLRAYANDHVLIVSNKSGTYEPDLPPSRGDFVQNMIDAISQGKENFISTNDTLSVTKACIAAEQSAKQNGTFITIP